MIFKTYQYDVEAEQVFLIPSIHSYLRVGAYLTLFFLPFGLHFSREFTFAFRLHALLTILIHLPLPLTFILPYHLYYNREA